ncbi:unnamed protein product [Spirodela intermedia]|uniref:Uncharacterized protein n=1 Tax=Spirodela intermedia TaxID=51605 RepID=A0A7I8KVX5_SPIIN|nr:unnamed protein product [Spirodela intermedia]
MPPAVPQKLSPAQHLPCFASPPFSIRLAREKAPRRSLGRAARFSCNGRSPPCRTGGAAVQAGYSGETPPSSSLSVEQWLADDRRLPSMIQSCSDEREVRRIHSLVVKLLGSSVAFLDNNLICAYLRFGNITEARKLFDKMLHRTVVSWTAILNGYQQLGDEAEFALLCMEMIESGVEANSLTYVCILNFCSKVLDCELGKLVHASIIKGKWRNLIVDSALLYFYVQCGDLASASALFDRMPQRDVVCWTTMITAYAQHGEGTKAFSMFSQMQHRAFLPNEFTVASILKACGEERTLKLGRQLHGAVVKGMFMEDVFVGSSLVFMYAKCGEVLDAKVVFDQMPSRNTVTWTSMIAGYAQNGFAEEAVNLFRKMKNRRISGNNLTVVSVLGALGSMRSLLLGKEIHGLTLKWSNQSSVHISSTLIWFYCQCGEYDYASRVLETLPTKDVIPWTAMITGYTNHGYGFEALVFLNQMLLEGIKPNPFTYSSALKACARLEDVGQGKRIHAAANKTRHLLNLFVGNSLISLYMKCGFPEDAVKIFDMMPERNCVSWKAMVTGYAKNGLCKEALRLMFHMQAEGFDVDDYIHSTVLTSCGDCPCELHSESSYLPCR